MAVGATGQDETIKIGVQTSIVGVKESIDKLKDLSRQLTAIDKQLRSGLNSDALNKQFQNIAKEFEKVTKSVTSGSAQSEKSIERMTSQVSKFNAELAKAQKSKGIGFVGDKNDAAAVKAYKERMDMAGHAVMGEPKNLAMAIANIRRFRKDMHDTSKVGIATAATLKAMDGGPPAFGKALSDSQKFKLSLGVVRENLMHVSLGLRSMAKDMQWVGRQMAEGITLPIVGLGVMATRSFMSVQSEMVQLKKVTEFGFGKSKEEADAFYDSIVNGAQGIREMSREFGVGRKAATSLFKEVAALGVDGEEDIKAFSNAVSEISMVGETDTATAMQFFRTMNAIFAEGRTNSEGLAETRDLMAQMSAVADETSLQLADLAAAFPEVAPVMKQMGFSAGGVAASLAGMYKRGIPATEAAHGLKFALQRLVSPTKDSKELIDKMGFSFFDAAGKIKKADLEVMALAKNLSPENMSAEESSKALGELFGLRQTARMQSYFQDINIGRVELEKFTAGTLEAADMTSDFARGLVASGEVAGAALTPMERYNKALEEIKKDPTTGLKRLKAGFDDFKVELGAALAPALLRVGEVVVKVLDLFGKMPGALQISIVAAGAFVAALAPIMMIAGNATHALITMGRTALRVLPKLAQNFTPSRAAGFIGGGQETAMYSGSKTMAVLSKRDQLKYSLGMRTSVEKAVETAGGAAKTSSLGPETAATSSLTTAKNNLTVASNRVAAAELREAATHEATTTAVATQAATSQAASKKAVASQVAATQAASKKNAAAAMTPLQQMQEARRKIDENNRKILKSGGFEATGAKSGGAYRKNGRFAAATEADAYLKEHLARQKAAERVRLNAQKNQNDLLTYHQLRAEKSRASAVAAQKAKEAASAKKAAVAQAAAASSAASAQNIKNVKNIFAPAAGAAAPTAVAGASAGQVAMVKAIRAREAARLAQIAQASQPPVPPAVKTPLIAAGAADKTKDIFKSLWLSASTTFFSPIGDAAGKTTEKLRKMAKAAKLSSAGQAVSGGFAATAGAFTKGRKGNLGGDAAGLAMMASYGKLGKIFGTLGAIFGKFTGVVKIGGGPIGKILTLLLRFNKITLILTVVAGAIAFVVMMFKGMKTNWEAVMAKIQPGIDAIKAAFGRLKETFAGVFEKMMGIFGQLGTGAEEGEGAASAFEGIGGIIGTVFNGIAAAIDFVGNAVLFLWPLFERTAYIVKNVVGFISALFQGEWKQAFMFLVATVYESARPIVVVFDTILKAAAQFVATLLDMFASMTGWVPWLGDAIKGARNALESFSDKGLVPFLDEKLRTGLGGIFGSGTTGPAKDKAKDAGGDIGNTLGEAINSGAGDAADGEGWVKKWVETVVSQIDKQLEKLKKSATDALEKAHEAALKVYDERIKAIEDQEKAEEKLYRTEEYLANKRNLLAKRNIDRQNYENERAVAIYEGRYNDARMLDLKEQADKQSYSEELTGIESSRSKDLLKETRDGLKEIITAEKDAAKARFDIQKQSFEDYLEELYKMTPVTVEQFQSMMDQINSVLEQSGANWPGYAETAMSRMAKVLSDANKSIINDFNRTENNPLLQWVAAFAEPEVVRILKEGLSKATGGGGSTGGAKTLTKEEGDFLAGLANPAANATPEQLADWVGKGQGFSPNESGSRSGVSAPRSLPQYKTADGWNPTAGDAAEQAAIDAIKQQISVGNMVNQNTDLFKIAMAQLAQDAAASWGSVTNSATDALNAVDEANNSSKEVAKYAAESMGSNWEHNLRMMILSSVNTGENLSSIFGRTSSEIQVHTDKNGEIWNNVNGKMVNRFGETAKYIIDENGRITNTIIKDNGEIVEISSKTYKNTTESALALFNDMKSKGIEPGTEAAKQYIDKINALGIAAVNIDGKTVFIKVDANTSKFYAAIEKINKIVRENKANGGFAGMTEIDMLANQYVSDTYDGQVVVTQFGRFKMQADGSMKHESQWASGGLVKAQKDGIIANIGEGGFDEYVITTDPKYRASNLGYLSAAASRLGVKMASGAAIKAASGGMFTRSGVGGSSAEYASGMGGDVYITVDTFIGEEQWFAEMAGKYNMKTVPRQRKIEGQQKRVVSSYNDRYRLR